MFSQFLRIGVWVAALTAATGFSQTPKTQVSDAAKQQDIYAIYSKLISSADEIYLIEATMLTSREGYGTLFDPKGAHGNLAGGPIDSWPGQRPCVRARSEDAVGFSEILTDYNLRKDTAVVLEREFNLEKPYRLLSRDEVKAFLEDADKRGGPAPAQVYLLDGTLEPKPIPPFGNTKRVFRLSGVYFNQSRSLALTYVSVLTSTADGSGGWKVFKRTGTGQWQEDKYGASVPGPTWSVCSWFSEA